MLQVKLTIPPTPTFSLSGILVNVTTGRTTKKNYIVIACLHKSTSSQFIMTMKSSVFVSAQFWAVTRYMPESFCRTLVIVSLVLVMVARGSVRYCSLNVHVTLGWGTPVIFTLICKVPPCSNCMLEPAGDILGDSMRKENKL